jgi:hypothetical protein
MSTAGTAGVVAYVTERQMSAAEAAATVVEYVNAKLAAMHSYHATDLPAFWRQLHGAPAREGAFTHLTVREQHAMQQRGGDY